MPLAIINARWQRATLPAVQRLQFRCGLAVLASVIVGASGSVCGQNYPTKPLRFILPYPPGGVTDVIARLIGQKMTETLGQPVIIDQRGGGASILGTELAAKSAADGYTLLLGTFGLHLIFSSMLPALTHIRTGRLRALGVSSAKRSPVLPHVPTLAEAGVNGYELISWYGVLVPGATPPSVVSRLNQVVTQAVQNTDVQEKLIAQGLEPATSTPAEFSRFIAAEVAKWSGVIRQIGVVHE
jgi:tripartite-type tricarboxylate transporter receptor subunit TctC